MNITLYHILHVFSLLVLTAHTYMAFANPVPENRKRTLMITGIATLPFGGTLLPRETADFKK